jgi:hypothetical protein
MVIVRLAGGLGNQMFQYATGFCLAKMRDVELRVDLTWFETHQLHQGFELDKVFRANVVQPSTREYRLVLGWMGMKHLRSLLGRRSLRLFRPRSLITEPHFHFWPEFFTAPADAYIDGYWQSEKYFLPAADLVRQTYTFAGPLYGRNAELSARIAESHSVAVHIRHGDYLYDPTINSVHGMSTLEYYEAAIQRIIARIGKPHFFIFSDDVKWARANLHVDHPCCYVEHNRGAESYNDMRLMSLCRYHIIANSSFSWWGAWLSTNPQKEVIAPAQWFRNQGIITSDLVPERWTRI